eukprot:scaffold22244_cov62-Phaeocystis_antarctica.AAC.2
MHHGMHGARCNARYNAPGGLLRGRERGPAAVVARAAHGTRACARLLWRAGAPHAHCTRTTARALHAHCTRTAPLAPLLTAAARRRCPSRGGSSVSSARWSSAVQRRCCCGSSACTWPSPPSGRDRLGVARCCRLTSRASRDSCSRTSRSSASSATSSSSSRCLWCIPRTAH